MHHRSRSKSFLPKQAQPQAHRPSRAPHARGSRIQWSIVRNTIAPATSITRFAILSWYLIGSRSSGVISSCLVAHCRHETERTLVPGYSFRKCVPTGVGSNLGFDASPLGAWLV